MNLRYRFTTKEYQEKFHPEKTIKQTAKILKKLGYKQIEGTIRYKGDKNKKQRYWENKNTIFEKEKLIVKTYFIMESSTKLIKIGKSKDPERRIKDLQTSNPKELKLILEIEGDYEKEFHNIFSGKRISGEWYDIL